MKLAAIVEGHGECDALRPLVDRVMSQLRPGHHVDVLRPVRVKRQKVVKEGELERALTLLGNRIGPDDVILVLLDSDAECAAKLGPTLLARARAARPDRKVTVVLAVSEFEAWLLGSIETMRGQRGIPADAPVIDAPESLSSPKGRISDLMSGEYQETIDQAALVGRIDVDVTRKRCPSFDKFVRELASLSAE